MYSCIQVHIKHEVHMLYMNLYTPVQKYRRAVVVTFWLNCYVMGKALSMKLLYVQTSLVSFPFLLNGGQLLKERSHILEQILSFETVIEPFLEECITQESNPEDTKRCPL